jgi:hypothetical protein
MQILFSPANGLAAALGSDVEAEQQHVAVPGGMVLALELHSARLLGSASPPFAG